MKLIPTFRAILKRSNKPLAIKRTSLSPTKTTQYEQQKNTEDSCDDTGLFI